MSQNIDLSPYGITDVREIVHNPSYEQLFEEELREDLEGYERGVLTESGAVAVRTGEFAHWVEESRVPGPDAAPG